MKIVIDLDSTIIDTSKTLINLYNYLFKDNIKYIPRHNWDFSPMINDKNKLKEILSLFEYSGFYDNVIIQPYAIECINRLCEKHEIIIATVHTDNRKRLTREWLSKVIPKAKLIFCDNFSQKGKMFSDANIIIDDRIDSLESFNKSIKICYGTYLWNRDWKGIRVYNWYELEYYIFFINKIKLELSAFDWRDFCKLTNKKRINILLRKDNKKYEQR